MRNTDMNTPAAQFVNTRRQYIVNKKLQRNFSFSFIALGFIISIFILTGFWYFAVKEIYAYTYRSHFVPPNTWRIVLPIMLKTFLIFLIVLVTASVLFIRFIFRQFSAKFESFRTAIEKIGNGDFSTPVLQNGFESLNEKLEKSRVNLHQKIADLQNTLERIKHASTSPVYDETTLKDIENLGAAFNDGLSQFKFSKE